MLEIILEMDNKESITTLYTLYKTMCPELITEISEFYEEQDVIKNTCRTEESMTLYNKTETVLKKVVVLVCNLEEPQFAGISIKLIPSAFNYSFNFYSHSTSAAKSMHRRQHSGSS